MKPFLLTFYQQNSSSHRRAQIGGKIHLFYIQIKVSLKVNRNAGTIPRWKRTRFGPAQRKLELRIEVIPEGQDQRQWENLRSDTLSHQMLHSFCHSPKRQDRQTRSQLLRWLPCFFLVMHSKITSMRMWGGENQAPK